MAKSNVKIISNLSESDRFELHLNIQIVQGCGSSRFPNLKKKEISIFSKKQRLMETVQGLCTVNETACNG